MFDGPDALFTQALNRPRYRRRARPATNGFGTLLAMTLLSFFAIVLLPRQFHVTVVENHNEGEIKRAAWLFPLYLVLINLFVVPIALAGMLTFPAGQGRLATCSCWRCRSAARLRAFFTVAAFVGGLSAATAMVIVESVALAIMVSNDHRGAAGAEAARGVAHRARRCRRAAAARCAASRSSSSCCSPISITARPATRSSPRSACLSFAAVAQLAPAFFGGLFWRRATARGAIAGMTIGILVWAYTLLLPSAAGTGLISAVAARRRAVGHLWFLRPQALFGLDLPPLAHGVFWSLALNILAYVGFSLSRAPTSIERVQADLFVPANLAPMAPSFRLWRSVGHGRGTDRHGRALSRRGAHAYLVREFRLGAAHQTSSPSSEADFQLLRYAEHLLASAIGAASSRLVLSLLLRKRTVSTKAALKLLDDANAAIHYNREILQTALDHVRQGIAVFDKDLQLVCWNRQFGEILDLPPDMIGVGIAARRDPALPCRARRARSGRDRRPRARADCALRRRRRSRSWSASPTAASVVEVRTNRDAGRRHRDHLHRHHAERRSGRSAGTRQ